MKKNILSTALLFTAAGTLGAFADYYDTGCAAVGDGVAYADFNAVSFTLSNLYKTEASDGVYNAGNLSGEYTLTDIGFVATNSTRASYLASYVAIIDSSYNVLAISGEKEIVTGSMSGRSSTTLPFATYAFSSEATLSEANTYYCVFLSSTDGLTVGFAFSATNVTVFSTNSSQNANYTETIENNVQTATLYTLGTAASSIVSWSVCHEGANAGLKVNVSAVAVPEPSAFGVLAGLGALVFATSRRRRRRAARAKMICSF